MDDSKLSALLKQYSFLSVQEDDLKKDLLDKPQHRMTLARVLAQKAQVEQELMNLVTQK